MKNEKQKYILNSSKLIKMKIKKMKTWLYIIVINTNMFYFFLIKSENIIY